MTIMIEFFDTNTIVSINNDDDNDDNDNDVANTIDDTNPIINSIMLFVKQATIATNDGIINDVTINIIKNPKYLIMIHIEL